MEVIKTTPALEFDVIYADGARKRVHEGVLFEVEENTMVFHNGTSRISVLFAVAEGALEVIGSLGLIDKFFEHLDERILGNSSEAGV